MPSRATADKLREYGYKGEIVVMENGCDMEIPDAEEIEALSACIRLHRYREDRSSGSSVHRTAQGREKSYDGPRCAENPQ